MTARLIGRTGKAYGVEQPVSEMLTLGSGPGNDLRIDSQTLSRQHAQIVKSGPEYYIEDLGSRNGTFLNGQQVKRFPIRHLDVISLGPDVDLIFVERGAHTVPMERPLSLRASIVWTDGPLAGHAQEIAPDRGLVLGRESGLGSLAAISRRHAVLTLRGNRVTVEDLGSANGTWVNGTLISAVTPLVEGDEVSLGGLVRLRLSILSGAPPKTQTEDSTSPPETIVVERSNSRLDRPLDVPRSSSAQVPAGAPETPVIPVTPIVISEPLKVITTESPTILAPREPAIAPARSGDAGHDGDQPFAPPVLGDPTMLAPREAAVAPRLDTALPAAAQASATFRPPREAAGRIPDAIAERARAARRVVDATMAAPPEAADVAPAPSPERSTPGARVSSDSGPVSGVIFDGRIRVTLNLGIFVVGRDPNADVVVDSRDIGRRHARLHVREDEVSVEDLQTANGTFVDDARVTGLSAVSDGSRIRFATVEFTVMYVRSQGQSQ